MDELTDEVGTELDNEKRLDMLREAARIVQDEVGFIPLHQQAIVWAARNNVDLVQLPTNYLPLMYVRVK